MITEQNFIKYLKKGNDKALNYIVDKYLGTVKAIVHKILYKNKEEIDECINDIFFSIWQNKNKFYGNDELEFKKWIFKISKYKAIDYYRKLNNDFNLEINENIISIDLSPEDNFIIKENEKEILKMLDNLKSIDRKIFIMKYYLGMKSQEISKILNLTPTAIDNRIYRGKKTLRDKVIGG